MEIRLSKPAYKYLQNLDNITEKRIRDALENLKENPPKGDIKPYKGRPKFFRLRIGKYRAIFCIKNDIINIVDIDSRGQVYK
jgi:mRNA interferase RelE/StbE